MKEISEDQNVTATKNPKDISGIYVFPLIVIFQAGFWNSYSHRYSELDQLISMLAILLSTVIYIALLIGNMQFITHLKNRKFIDFSRYFSILSVLGDNKIWGNKYWWRLFIPIQLTNFFLTFYPENYRIWLYATVGVIIASLIVTHIEKYKEISILVLGNILFAITVFSVLNFRVLGVYFYWAVTGNDCFINYGFEDEGDPLAHVEFIWSIAEWQTLGHPLPDSENQLQFFTYKFWDTLVFQLYPIIIFLILLNVHLFFAKVTSINLSIDRLKSYSG